MINWNRIMFDDQAESDVTLFSLGLLSRDDFYGNFVGTPAGGLVRRVLRTRGVTESRRLARKALKRRGILNSNNIRVK